MTDTTEPVDKRSGFKFAAATLFVVGLTSTVAQFVAAASLRYAAGISIRGTATAAIVLTGCSSPPSGTRPTEEAVPSDAGCITVSQFTIDTLTAGLIGVTIAHAAAYKAGERENVYFIAVELVSCA